MRIMRLATAGLASIVWLTSCADQTPVSPPELAISDAMHDGNHHFYFLPPMAPDADYAGSFDGSLNPVVRITENGATLVELTPTAGAADKSYHVNWNTHEHVLRSWNLYRIRVLLDGFELGFADVTLASNASQLKDVNTGAYIPLVDGQTLPIRFRIEEGARPANLVAVDLARSTLTINRSDYVPFTYQVDNPTTQSLCPESGPIADRSCTVGLQSYIEQPTANRAAGGTLTWCEPYVPDTNGQLPPGVCTGHFSITARDLESAGNGRLVSGPATARFILKIDRRTPEVRTEILDSLRIPIELQIGEPSDLIPILLDPEESAVLDNGCSTGPDRMVWDFSWAGVTGAEKYQIVVQGENASRPLLDINDLAAATLHYDGDGYIFDTNRHNFLWAVRAQVEGTWGFWSEVRSFDVEPLNTDCGG